MLTTNYCATCGVLKPLSAFHKDARKPNGHQESCKECRNAKDRERYRAMPDEKKKAIVDRTRARRASGSTRCLNWDRVHQLLLEAILWQPTVAAQNTGALIEELKAGYASKPLPRGGAPASWDWIIDIRACIRRTKDADLACRIALAGERLDVIRHVLLPRAEAAVAWSDRQYSTRREAWAAKRELNATHAEIRVLEREIDNIRRRAAYTTAMQSLSHDLYKLGVR